MTSDTNSSASAATSRPFPWHCPRCRKKEVRRATVEYRCQRVEGGVPVTVAIPDLSVPRCDNCGELVFDYVAEAQINEAFHARRQADGDTAQHHPEKRTAS